ncbi:hypothetical protein [Actinomadura sp. 7K507]|uniref:hypothetical protein n=1 Tax=Actinomadura sp. 7K507 TaxID=2530365 RepID=UPI001050463C|nr:hypothetical protein [Actinomadura sp. 7K507]TDC86033.1 hypothetical protein E1285_24285 [Actinomadura sp. 7K507]
MTKAVLKDGKLLLSHEAGCGATEITPEDPRYEELHADAVEFDDLADTPEENAALGARWRRKWALEDRRTA